MDVVEGSSGNVLVFGFSDVMDLIVVVIDAVVASDVGSIVVLFIGLFVVDTGSFAVVLDGSVTIVVVVGDSVVAISQSTIQGQLHTPNSGS